MNSFDTVFVEAEQCGTRFQQHQPSVVALDVAENILLMEQMRDMLVEPPLQLTQQDLNYPHDSIGDPQVRQHIADLLSGTWGLRADFALQAEHVLCTPGASAALYLHAKVRLKEGDRVLVPAPYWQMFDRIYSQLGITLVPLEIEEGAESSISLPVLQQRYTELAEAGTAPAMLLLTNPHNPLGIVESGATLQAVFEWVLSNTSMEIVSDEIYAHSIFDSAASFVSAMAVPAAIDFPERVHVIWGLAKDFGLSGWMIGILLTRSTELHDTITRVHARFSPVDGLKNRVLRRLLSERPSAQLQPDALLKALPNLLQAAHEQVAQTLCKQEIPFRQSQGAPFFWLDLRDYLDDDLEHVPHPASCILDEAQKEGFDPREGRVQKYLACVADVVLLRGQAMHSSEPGFFRLCFSAAPTPVVVAAVEKMGAALRAVRGVRNLQ